MRRIAICLSLLCVCFVSVHGQAKRSITEADILKFTWIADPQMSPDGKQVAFVRVVINEKTDDYETSLFRRTAPRRSFS
jgi:hypothetical protein